MEIKKVNTTEIIELSKEDLEVLDRVLHTCIMLGAQLGCRANAKEYELLSNLTMYISCAEMDEQKVTIVID